MKSKPGKIHKHTTVIVDHKTFPYTICGMKRSFHSDSVPWIVVDCRMQFFLIMHPMDFLRVVQFVRQFTIFFFSFAISKLRMFKTPANER